MSAKANSPAEVRPESAALPLRLGLPDHGSVNGESIAGGDGWGGGGPEERERFPVARTCFNMLILYRYDYREALEAKLWRAVEESEGFGLK